MMYQSDGSQSKKDPNVFLGNFAEGILEDLRKERQPKEGDRAFGDPVGMAVTDRSRIRNYV